MALEQDLHAGTELSGRTSIRAKLIKSFTVATLIPSLITVVVGVMVIRRQIYTQAEAQVNSDFQGALEIWRSQLERLKDAVRIHATRMVIYRALEQKDPANLEPEMERIRKAEGLDILTLTDTQGRIFYRTRNPLKSGDSQAGDELVRHAMLQQAPGCSAVIINAAELAKESLELQQQAFMEITPTPMASPPRARCRNPRAWCSRWRHRWFPRAEPSSAFFTVVCC